VEAFAPSSREFAKAVCEATKEQWRKPEPAPRTVALDDRPLAEALANMNHRARNAFWSLRRHGKSEAQALELAWRALPR
jgi:hypothetical protein